MTDYQPGDLDRLRFDDGSPCHCAAGKMAGLPSRTHWHPLDRNAKRPAKVGQT